MNLAIVDPYSSGALLARAFADRGVDCVMVQSGSSVPPAFRSSFNPGAFSARIVHEGELEHTAGELAARNVRWVLAGCESGVELADALSETLGLPTNGSTLSAARRNKWLMAETVRSHGLGVPAQWCGDRIEILVRRALQTGIPVIVKPLDSSASDGVHYCRTREEIQRAFGDLVGRRTVLGGKINSVLVQEYLAGNEYVVDTVSYAGEHKAAAFWRYGKPAGDPPAIQYDSMEFLPAEGRLQEMLFGYVRGVLDALGIRYGPCHCEVIVRGNEPFLVELGARLNAGINARMGELCGGKSQVQLTVEAFLDPSTFLEEPGWQQAFEKLAANFFLMPKPRERFHGFARLPEIRALESFHDLSIASRPHQTRSATVGLVTLLHRDQKVIRSDIDQIRFLEKNGLYEFERGCDRRTDDSPGDRH